MDLAKHWRLKAARYRLEGERRTDTGEVRFPPQSPGLGDEAAWESFVLSGHGEIFSFSVLRQAPSGFDNATPYAVALVRLDEGPLITAQLTDCAEADLRISLRVEMVTRRLQDTGPDGLLVYSYKFRPLLRSTPTDPR